MTRIIKGILKVYSHKYISFHVNSVTYFINYLHVDSPPASLSPSPTSSSSSASLLSLTSFENREKA